ncbi:MAG: DNA replication and repair protein RecF [Flavobacteriaceae bacterium]|jgi:DNA replication and repair protein RecF|nr:DNA replication and repair protein RecF [Flavobacteriaceae bacterium]MDG1920981.1 DNA replication and repair protein RecF [Flavobacteriaceae bacterium]
MYLKQLSLTQYKNIRSKTFDFNPKINCFVGDNGKGKSNILDAIYHLAFGKSYFNPIASQNIQLGEDFFVVEGRYEREEREEKIVCSLKKGQKKVMKRNGKVYEKLSDHIGLIPTVIISPADRDLIAEGSSTRRKFMDGVIGQTDAVFLQNLIEYHRILSQRNALLKFFALNNTFESDTLAVYNDQLSQRSTALYEKRKAFMETFIPVFNTRYQDISEGNERVDLEYESQLHQNSHKALLESSLEKDKILQYTSTGIHKDDINFLLEAQPIKKFGSQGQQKTFLIALKLAQFDFLKKQTGGAPLLLLDDAFDKLDQKRVTQIISLVDQNDFGQIFLTDTHEERTLNALHSLKSSYELFKL